MTNRAHKKRPKQVCAHADVICMNHFEPIRKYRCTNCRSVLMCDCDRDVAENFLAHQLNEGSDYEAGENVVVDGGFQSRVCRTCRGLSPVAHPMSETHGRTTKLRRYYWRELMMAEYRYVLDFARSRNLDNVDLAYEADPQLRDRAAEHATKLIKSLHETAPLYDMTEESDDAFLRRLGVDVWEVHGTYIRTPERRAQLLLDGGAVSVEAFAARKLESEGYSVMTIESRPFHVLFGTFMWTVVTMDPMARIVGVADRDGSATSDSNGVCWFSMARDFGAPSFGKRNAEAVEDELRLLGVNAEDLLWVFDYSQDGSKTFRNYLWAHSAEDVARARALIPILGVERIRTILRFLAVDYWRRFCGWPDLLAFRNNELLLVEVKSSGDRLTDDQRRWIGANVRELGFPFRLCKVHRKAVVDAQVVQHDDAANATDS